MHEREPPDRDDRHHPMSGRQRLLVTVPGVATAITIVLLLPCIA